MAKMVWRSTDDSLQGESLADFEAANAFRTEVNNLMTKENPSEEQLYDCVETGFHIKQLPTKFVFSRNEICALVFKQRTERLTSMWCSISQRCTNYCDGWLENRKKPSALKYCYSSLTSLLYKPKILLKEYRYF